jgi:hypothetical protein
MAKGASTSMRISKTNKKSSSNKNAFLYISDRSLRIKWIKVYVMFMM